MYFFLLARKRTTEPSSVLAQSNNKLTFVNHVNLSCDGPENQDHYLLNLTNTLTSKLDQVGYLLFASYVTL